MKYNATKHQPGIETLMSTEPEAPYRSSNPPPTFDPLAPEKAVAKTFYYTLDHNAHTFDPPDQIALRLREFTLAAENGDLSHVRRILANQIVMLERLFHHLMARLPCHRISPKEYDGLIKLALRTQTQIQRTSLLMKQLGQPRSAPQKEKSETPTTTTTPPARSPIMKAPEVLPAMPRSRAHQAPPVPVPVE